MRLQFIDGAEIQIARDEDGPAIALVLVQRGFDVDGGLENQFRHAVAGGGGMLVDPQTLRAARVRLRRSGQADSVLHERQHKSRTETVPPMVIDNTHQAGGAQGVGGRGIQIDHHAHRGLDPGPEEKEPALTLGHRGRIFTDRFRAAFEENDAAIVTIDIAVQDTGRHARHFIDHPHS